MANKNQNPIIELKTWWNSISKEWKFALVSVVILLVAYTLVSLNKGESTPRFMEVGQPVTVGGGKYKFTLKKSGPSSFGGSDSELTLRVENLQRKRAPSNWYTIDVYGGDGTSYVGNCDGHFGDLPAGAAITQEALCWGLEYESSWHFTAPRNKFSWD